MRIQVPPKRDRKHIASNHRRQTDKTPVLRKVREAKVLDAHGGVDPKDAAVAEPEEGARCPEVLDGGDGDGDELGQEEEAGYDNKHG